MSALDEALRHALNVEIAKIFAVYVDNICIQDHEAERKYKNGLKIVTDAYYKSLELIDEV